MATVWPATKMSNHQVRELARYVKPPGLSPPYPKRHFPLSLCFSLHIACI